MALPVGEKVAGGLWPLTKVLLGPFVARGLAGMVSWRAFARATSFCCLSSAAASEAPSASSFNLVSASSMAQRAKHRCVMTADLRYMAGHLRASVSSVDSYPT